jgi:hypothetical protein
MISNITFYYIYPFFFLFPTHPVSNLLYHSFFLFFFLPPFSIFYFLVSLPSSLHLTTRGGFAFLSLSSYLYSLFPSLLRESNFSGYSRLSLLPSSSLPSLPLTLLFLTAFLSFSPPSSLLPLLSSLPSSLFSEYTVLHISSFTD